MWVKVDDTFVDDPRAVTVGPAGVGVLLLCLCYTNRNLSDGWVPEAFALRLTNGDSAVLNKMIELAMLTPDQRAGIPGFQIHHDYMQHQFTRAQEENRRRLRASVGKLGGIESGITRRKPETKQIRSKPEPKLEQTGTKAEVDRNRPPSSRQAKANPDPDPDPVVPETSERAVPLTRDGAHARNAATKNGESVAAITKVAHEVFDVLARTPQVYTNADVSEALKERCAYYGIPYKGDVIQRGIDSASYQRRLAGKPAVLPGSSGDVAFTLNAKKRSQGG